VAGNKRVPVSSSRSVMKRTCTGIVDMEGTALIAYSDGIYMLVNRRGANTGEDEDYRLFTINEGRGCISYLGLTSGNGWAAYPTTEGIVVTDKTGREFIISGDVYNPSDGLGDLAYEINMSAASAASDSDDQYLSMMVMGSKLAVAFRTQQTYPGKVLFYDFSPGIEASGVEELINPETKRPYIWSPPATYGGGEQQSYPFGAMGSIRNASGRLDYLCTDDTETSSRTGDGRLDQINTGNTDNGYEYVPYAVVAPFSASEFMAMSPQRLEVVHTSVAGGASTMMFANDQVPSFNNDPYFLRALPVVAAKTQYQKQNVPIAAGQRGKTDMFWILWKGHQSGNTSTRFYKLTLQYDEVENAGNSTGSA
jgi:hypothetical protein